MVNRNYHVKHQPHHPKATASGCVYAHVVVAEQAVGRFLPPRAEVHHVNGNHRDNRPCNLVVCEDKAYHKLLHYRARVLRAGGNPNTDKICCDCGVPKPLAYFNVMRSNKSSGRQSVCRECSKVRDAAKRERQRACRA